MEIILVIVAAFGLCFLVDKGFTRLFRSKAQHRSGLSVRQNKRYASFGLVLMAIGIASLVTAAGNRVMIVGGILLAIVGMCLIVYYLSFGIYYDDDGFLLESFGKKSISYRYRDIVHQQLYNVQGGSVIIELHMTDGSAVQVVSTMPDYDRFLDHAFTHWCRQKGIDPQNCAFHDVSACCWFPKGEVE